MEAESFIGFDKATKENDDRTVLNKPLPYIGQLFSRFLKVGKGENKYIPVYGTATLIQIEELSSIFKANDD